MSLNNNQLSGCVPQALQNISAIQTNLATLGLPRCHPDLAALTALYDNHQRRQLAPFQDLAA